jgi:hypothetical protein
VSHPDEAASAAVEICLTLPLHFAPALRRAGNSLKSWELTLLAPGCSDAPANKLAARVLAAKFLRQSRSYARQVCGKLFPERTSSRPAMSFSQSNEADCIAMLMPSATIG